MSSASDATAIEITDLDLLPPAVRQAVLDLQAQVAHLSELTAAQEVVIAELKHLTDRQEHLIAELRHARFGKKSEKQTATAVRNFITPNWAGWGSGLTEAAAGDLVHRVYAGYEGATVTFFLRWGRK
jgi:hypothetical protein